MKTDERGPGALSLGYAEELHDRWRADPDSVPADWREWFSGEATRSAPAGEDFRGRVDRLVEAHRAFGYLSPKSLLRDPRAVSSLEDLSSGRFRRVLPDPGSGDAPGRRVLLTTGRLAWDLADRRRELGRSDVDVVRLEQLYPLPEALLAEALARHPNGTPVVWVQEEPENMGAWRWLRARFGPNLLDRLPFSVISRPESASPATGSVASHRLEQEHLLAAALGGGDSEAG
mgnify:CR=1 FL=1